MCQSSSWTAEVQRGRPLLALDRETADEEKPPGNGTLTELRRMQPLANGAQSRRYEAVLDDLSTSRVGDRYAGTEMVAARRVHGGLQLRLSLPLHLYQFAGGGDARPLHGSDGVPHRRR